MYVDGNVADNAGLHLNLSDEICVVVTAGLGKSVLGYQRRNGDQSEQRQMGEGRETFHGLIICELLQLVFQEAVGEERRQVLLCGGR